MSVRYLFPVAVATLALSVVGCQKKSDKELAPVASALEPAKAKTDSAVKAEIDTGASEVTWVMRAPLENIYGVARSATTGELFVDLSDIGKTSGLVKVDLQKLVLTQEKRETEEAEFGEREKKDAQNEHAKTWLEITEDADPEQRKKNEIVEFKITSVKDVSKSDVSKLSGAKREITATVTGEFVLHQRQVEKTAKMNIVFEFDGERAKTVRMTTVEPFIVDLAEHDVRPRKAFGVLADATLATLGNKVDKQPKISLDFVAKLSSRR